MEQFAIYTRASEEGEDGLSSSPEDQEAAARAWADRNDVEVVDVVHETASGGSDASDRALGKLIDRCEAGELNGIIVRDEKRFARDTIVGGVALARLVECDGRLVATWSGFDSKNLTPEMEMNFNILMSIGQAERKRNLLRRMRGKEKFVAQGGWAGVAPFGYDKDENGRLVPTDDAEIVRELFRRRADGIGFSELARRFPRVSRSGVRKIIMNRSYLGEQRIPDPKRKGQPQVAANYPGHEPLVTAPEWEAANAIEGRRAPVHTGLGERVELKGVVRCGSCRNRRGEHSIMHVLLYGKEKNRLTYACTTCGKTSMAVDKIEPAVLRQLDIALEEHEPHVAAVMEGDTRYTDALAAVEQAQADLVAYRDSIEIQRELGVTAFAAGLKARKEALATARRALRETPRPFEQSMTAEEFAKLDARRYYPRLIAEVLVYPRSAKHRLTTRWTGAEDAFPVPPLAQRDLADALGVAAA
jgi:DNA invertase Pin-like site-specific DNA recombinase